jgi:hypothetical protein
MPRGVSHLPWNAIMQGREYFSGLYQEMLTAEVGAGPKEAIAASTEVINKSINDQGFESYETFIFGR